MYKCSISAGPRKAEIHLENAEIHLKIVRMNLQWIENDEINLKKLNSHVQDIEVVLKLKFFICGLHKNFLRCLQNI